MDRTVGTVTVILRGGLGNQMFEYAAGLSAALRSGRTLLVDATYLHDRFPRRQFTHRDYDLDVFTINAEFTAFSKISAAAPVPGLWLGLDIAGLSATKLLARRDSVMWGFYQSERYFEKNKEAVRAAFTFRNPITGEAAAIGASIDQTQSVSIHVRRGDYTLPKYKKLYGDTDVDYYRRAIAHVADKVRTPHFFVFSDDPAWCREHIKPPFPTTYLDDATRGPKASFHLRLMSRCKHNIIANSSFSWWGAWLNANPDKIVIAPKQWSHNTTSTDEQVVPSSWIRM